MDHDPVCGMPVDPASPHTWRSGGVEHVFCSELCLTTFRSAPERFLARVRRPETTRTVAYFSMEIAVDPGIPTYSGGLGVLAGDMLRSCADLRVPIVAVSLLHRRGYLTQELDAAGRQRERAAQWDPGAHMQRTDAAIDIEIEGRRVRVTAWRFDVRGVDGFVVPVYFLDTDLSENAAPDRALAGELYGGDDRYRLAQEIVLGVAGRRLLGALGHSGIRTLHLNEGHAALAAWDLLDEVGGDFEAARARCVFTTHTPVPAGHDRFPIELVRRLAPAAARDERLAMLGGERELDTTRLALNLSGFVNGVAVRHREVTEEMFPGYAIHHVTNGVHSRTWTCPSVSSVFDTHIPGWERDPAMLRHALRLPSDELWRAHQDAKLRLIELVAARTGARLDRDVLLIGFGRRATAYKRADLVFADLDRLRPIAEGAGGIQIVLGGKAHPRDDEGKRMIERVVGIAARIGGGIRAVYVPDYDLEAASRFVSGSDLWLNTPQPPMEASGTSGMKAAHNGVPSLSARDGWWLEGHVEGITGWAADDARQLYDALQHRIVPAYRDRAAWTAIMKHAIALNASYFNTHRVVQQYAAAAYLSGAVFEERAPSA